MATSTLQELGALHLSRPTADAPVATVAAWHDRRATVLDHLAAEGNPTAHDLAVSAHHHALALLSGGTR
jgi:hypothetical protein